jgi:2,3-dihydroxy-2,3-dihydro-p-cumate dehydrogenase
MSSDARFSGRVAIVTGAGGAIGAEIAARLGSEGAELALVDLNPETVERNAATLGERLSRDVIAVAGDLSTPEPAQEVVAACRERFGRIDVLVNNAGGGIIRPTLEQTEETLRATLDRNIWTAIRATLAVLPGMKEAGYGRVVFIGADSVRNGLENHAVYNAAKGGVHAFARGLAREYARDGITVNTVSPCATATPELAQIMERDPALGEAFTRVIPIGRPAALEEVASAVAFLASEEARFITGQVLGVNGGSTMV